MALLIGNQAYSNEIGALKNPINDVQLIRKSLTQIGFASEDITVVKDGSRGKILGAIDRYTKKLSLAGDGAIGFLYYSGHGVANSHNKRNYLIPVGVRQLDDDVWYDAIRLDHVVATLRDTAPNAAHFVVFDACRNVFKTLSKGGKGFEPVQTHQGMMIAFSTAPGNTASDEGNGSGPYASALAAELVKPGLDHLGLFQNVKESVIAKGGGQIPWERNGLVRRVYLADKTVVAANNPIKTPPTTKSSSRRAAGAGEIAYWETVKDSDDPADLQLYLDQFPDGIFAALAKRFIGRLENSKQKSEQAKQTSVELAEAEERRKLAEKARLDAALQAARARHATELATARREAKRAQRALEDAQRKQATAKKADEQAREESRLAEKATNETKLEVVASVATPTSPSRSAAAAPFAATRATIKEAQERLYELNYDVGEIDGLMGDQTRQTILAFEADAKITQNDGRLTLATLEALRKAASLAPWGAIAYSKKSDSWGAAWKHTTRKAATAAAIKTCGQASCDTRFTFFGKDCAAFAHSDANWAIAAEGTISKASSTAKKQCKVGSKNCQIIAAFCANGEGAPNKN
ncbi:MAG: caspase family protein [Pseudomonadota bacterium]